MEPKTKVLVVTYDGPDSGSKLLGVVEAPEAAELLISMDFMQNQDHESFCVAFDAAFVPSGRTTTKMYPIVEHGEDPENAEEFYIVRETGLY